MIYVFLATGFEDIEALAPVDIMRRASLQVKTVSITNEQIVTSAHGVGIVADMLLSEVDFTQAKMLVLPGGMPGAANLDACTQLTQAIANHYNAGGAIAAICAAPLVFGHLGLLQGRRATCYPGFEDYLTGATYTGELVTVDGNVITGEGPAATFCYAYTLCEMLCGKATAEALKEGMMYNHLMEGK
jgi:4-methyl-5(b-hydroxyethyl)-thiazole monophosphate biosynthesis